MRRSKSLCRSGWPCGLVNTKSPVVAVRCIWSRPARNRGRVMVRGGGCLRRSEPEPVVGLVQGSGVRVDGDCAATQIDPVALQAGEFAQRQPVHAAGDHQQPLEGPPRAWAWSAMRSTWSGIALTRSLRVLAWSRRRRRWTGLVGMRCSSTASSSSIENTVTYPATVDAA